MVKTAPAPQSQPIISGPCIICGGTNYDLSCGGPTICPKCDCGQFDAATVMTQSKALASLRAKMDELTAAITMARTRCNAALMGDEPCKPCIELAMSYLDEALAVNSQHSDGGAK